ncbi:TPA: hypothetical protein N0F65_012296 [Lagenidium giganteum]|uniref:Uncharacterized protein n=1 Tax=Lagenidium giganteum TaxID=4803 RepID=A0AAV2ZJA8_9STRA|nr:TPA: hypothetical protein N0F65_012296 [Lagenidium giganteum]
MSGWGLRLNPWSTSYSTLEAQQMRFIHKAYCEAMEVGEEDLPTQLKMDETFYPMHRPTPADFDEHTFMRKMQDVTGLLRNPAEAIISTICAYQRERYERFSFSGYLNDPRTLLLEEFKDWAMRTLAPASCTTESILNEVRRRHSYVLRLQHGQQGLFHSGSGERSLLGTLKDVRNVIETRILPAIEAERAHSSAREQLHTLEARGTDGLMHGVQFLFYVLRNTPNTPADCTISNLQSQQHAGMKDAMQTKSGQMLQVLLTTPSFKTLFPEGSNSQRDTLHPLQLTMDEENEMRTTAVFCDTSSRAVIPSVLTRSKSRQEESAITPADFLSQSNSGVVPLRAETAIAAYDTFTRLHGLLKLLADLLVSCRKARQLAGPGGDLLVYGPGGEEVRRLMQSLETVQTEISRLVSQLTQIGVRELDRLKPNQEKAWRWSFSKVLPLENYLAHDFGACVEPIQRIYSNADPLHVQKMYKQFREATGMWVKENNTICKQVFGALGASFVERPPIKQLDMEDGDEDSNRVELLEDSKTKPLMLPPSESARAHQSHDQEDRRGSTRAGNKVLMLEAATTDKSPPNSGGVSELVASDANAMVLAKPNQQLAHTDSSLSFLSSAATLVSWAVGGGKKAPSNRRLRDQELSPQQSESDEDEIVLEQPPNSTSSTCSNSSNAGPSPGVLDVLLLVRQSIQRIGQLSWGLRTSYHTSAFDEGDFDAFIVLCSIYEGVGVQCYSDLLIRVRRHRTRLRQLLQRHIMCIVGSVMVLQNRIVDEQKSISGMLSVYRRLDSLFSDFELDLDALLTDFKQMMVDCVNMKQGILTMPLSQQNEMQMPGGAATYAYQSINALATRIGGPQAPSAAILSHGEYMAQMNSQMDLHWNSISHLQQSVKGTLDAVCTVTDRLRECSKDSRNVVPPQQLDYIFEYNYEGFFRQTTKDLQTLLASFDQQPSSVP